MCFAQFMFLAFRNVLNAYKLSLYGYDDPLDSAVTQERCIDVFINDDDEYSKAATNGVYENLLTFQKVRERTGREGNNTSSLTP